MRVYPSERIQNVALIAHGGSGKTSLVDVALYDSGAVTRIGRVDDGTSVIDIDPDEVRRRMSLSLKVVPIEWGNGKINLLDTPGYADFVGEVKSGLRAADAAVILVTAEKGVEVGTELAWRFANERHLPRMVFITKLDHENSSFDRTVQSLRDAFGSSIAPLYLPIGHEASLRGVVDLICQRAYTFDNGKPIAAEIPADMADTINRYREMLVESAVECDDELMLRYLDGQAISDEELRHAIQVGVTAGSFVPVVAGSITRNIGVSTLLDTIQRYFPDALAAKPATLNGHLAALAFKTIVDPQRGQITYIRVYSGALKADSRAWNAHSNQEERIGQLLQLRGKQQEIVPEAPAGDIVCTVKLTHTHTGDTLCEKEHPLELEGVSFPEPQFTTAIAPRSKSDLDKLSNAITRIVEEDPSVHTDRDRETAETLLSGVGEAHIDIMIERMQRKFGVEVVKHDLHVPYRETIRKPARANGRFKRQSGGHGQFGDVWLEIEPLPPESTKDFIFENKIVGGVVPKEYVPGVEKGVREALAKGFLAGYPMINVRVALVDGKYHPVDSSAQAFEIAASYGMKEAVPLANPTIMEPIMNVVILAPETNMGDISSDLNTKRGRIQGMESVGDGYQRITAQAPMAEMLHYATDLRSITQGRGSFIMTFAHYEDVPAPVQQHLVEEHAHKEQAS